MNDDELRDWFEIGRLGGMFDFSHIKDDDGNEVCDSYETAVEFVNKYTDWLYGGGKASGANPKGFINSYVKSQERIANKLYQIISDSVIEYENPCFNWEDRGLQVSGIIELAVEYKGDIINFYVQQDSSVKIAHNLEYLVFSKDELDKIEAYILRWVLQMTESA